jgi:hypothetical protein
MDERYLNIEILKNSEDKRYYKNIIYPEIPLSEEDYYLITNQETRLETLANQFYKDPSLWWIISIANDSLPQNSMFIKEEIQIRIPQNLSEIKSKYNELNRE